MAECKIVFNTANGKVVRVEPPPAQAVTYAEYDIETLTPGQIEELLEPGISWKQSRTINFTHKPGRSICCIVVGGKLYRWC